MDTEDSRSSLASPLSFLFDDLLIHIFSFCDSSTLFRLGWVNSKFRNLSSQSHLWSDRMYKPEEVEIQSQIVQCRFHGTLVKDFHEYLSQDPRRFDKDMYHRRFQSMKEENEDLYFYDRTAEGQKLRDELVQNMSARDLWFLKVNGPRMLLEEESGFSPCWFCVWSIFCLGIGPVVVLLLSFLTIGVLVAHHYVTGRTKEILGFVALGLMSLACLLGVLVMIVSSSCHEFVVPCLKASSQKKLKELYVLMDPQVLDIGISWIRGKGALEQWPHTWPLRTQMRNWMDNKLPYSKVYPFMFLGFACCFIIPVLILSVSISNFSIIPAIVVPWVSLVVCLASAFIYYGIYLRHDPKTWGGEEWNAKHNFPAGVILVVIPWWLLALIALTVALVGNSIVLYVVAGVIGVALLPLLGLGVLGVSVFCFKECIRIDKCWKCADETGECMMHGFPFCCMAEDYKNDAMFGLNHWIVMCAFYFQGFFLLPFLAGVLAIGTAIPWVGLVVIIPILLFTCVAWIGGVILTRNRN